MFTVNIPTHINNDNELTEWVQENKESFYPAMDLDPSVYDQRAIIEDIEVTDIEIDEKTLRIWYRYEYSASYGCKDMYHSDISDEMMIFGQRNDGNEFLFEEFIPTEIRSTDKEF